MSENLTPLERLVQDELAKAGKGEEALAVARTWRAIAVRALADVLSGRAQNHLGVLGTVVHAAELYGYTLMNESFAAGDPSVRFARRGITEVMQYLDWCHSFLSHLTIVAAELPPPVASSLNIETTARANALILADMLYELRDESDKVEASERAARDMGHPDAMGTISVSTNTFRNLARVLGSIVTAWMTPEERTRFGEVIERECVEMTELHDLVRMHVNERDDEGSDDEAASGQATDAAPAEKK